MNVNVLIYVVIQCKKLTKVQTEINYRKSEVIILQPFVIFYADRLVL